MFCCLLPIRYTVVSNGLSTIANVLQTLLQFGPTLALRSELYVDVQRSLCALRNLNAHCS